MVYKITRDKLIRPLVSTALALGMSMTPLAYAAQVSLSLVDEIGNPVTGFRYLVEEDATYKPTLNTPSLDSLSFQFHKSHNPVATDATGNGLSGSSDAASVDIILPDNKDYFISVVPFNGHALGGIAVGASTGIVNKTVVVNKFKIPTAQISIRVFEDNNPVNGAIDLGERGLQYSLIDGQKHYFDIKLFDAAGQYGAAGGRVFQDAFGNPLGTTYDVNGTPTIPPKGFTLRPDATGYLVIKNLPPAKYGIEITPPARAGNNGDPLWFETSTIEGTRTIDAWVKANEPEVFVEFGPPGPHVFVGFVRDYDCISGDVGFTQDGLNACQAIDITDPLNPLLIRVPGSEQVVGGATISGQIVDNHMIRPGPTDGTSFDFSNGTPFKGCRVAVNLGIAGRTIYSHKCDFGENPDVQDARPASFEVNNLAPGSYSLSIWDDGLDAVISNHPFKVTGDEINGYSVSSLLNPQQLQNPTPVAVTANQTNNCGGSTGNLTCDFGQIPVFNWFHKVDTLVFFDRNQNGFRDCTNETNGGFPVGSDSYCKNPEIDDVTLHADASATNLRFRDGRIYKSVPIDVEGAAPHEEVFPFFHWLVAEVDFGTLKATGATMTADAGGDSPTLQSDGYVAQQQTVPACSGAIVNGVDTADLGEGCSHDGGLSRTETGAVLTQAFQGFLGQKNTIEFGKTNYAPGENGGISGMAIYAVTRAEDDPRFAVAEQWEPGIPRVQVALYQDALDVNGVAAPLGDGIIDDINGIAGIQQPDVDNYPLGWSTGGLMGAEDVDNNTTVNGLGVTGVFDQGDAVEVTWTDSWDDNEPTNCPGANNLTGLADTKCFDGLRNWNQVRPGVFDGGYAFSQNLSSGYYIVQSFTPPGYTLLKEEDKNVDFGDEYAFVTPQTLPPVCLGAPHQLPPLLSHVTVNGVQVVTSDPNKPDAFATPGYIDATTPVIRPLCDTKRIRVADGKNAAADFHYFTEVPKAAHVVGGVINDVANEFDPAAPTFGEKFSPPWVPVAFYDFNGNQVARVYTDQFGKYNALLPSTNTVNIASASGMSPNMLTACMNDSGLVLDPQGSGNMITDPNHNPQYSQFCYTFQYMPGGTTYLDTPVVSIAAFAGSGFQLDCDAADTTPMVSSVFSAEYPNHGAYISDPNSLTVDRTLTINSAGLRSVPNPSSKELSLSKNIVRNYGFGTAEGTVIFIDAFGNEQPAYVNAPTDWTDSQIKVEFPQGLLDGNYQLVVENASGFRSPMGVTVTVGPLKYAGSVIRTVNPSSAAGATPIQDALDASAQTLDGRGDIILVAPGTYDELPIMYQPVALQGAGAYSTIINARSVPAEKVTNWKSKIDDLLGLPNSARDGLVALFDLVPGQDLIELFVTEEGPGLMVAGKIGGNTAFTMASPSRMDGFTITGASTGGGIMFNGFVKGFTVSNNLISGNQGTYGGGIRIGHNTIKEQAGGILRHPNTRNENITIRNNSISRNGVFNGAGGGIAIYTGSKNYTIEDNLICGNFALTDGAGIGHLGNSSGGLIANNQIIFNQSFRQTPGFETDGGGILIAGADSFTRTGLTEGAGHVEISKNLIQGNQAGAGDGAGIALRRVNGADIVNNEKPNKWWLVNITNNTIVNNVTGYAGGGISLKDSVRVAILNNTIANNESTATAGAAFAPGSPGLSTQQVAGIARRGHETLVGLINAEDNVVNRYGQSYSNPIMTNNIIWNNRSRIYDLTTNLLIDPIGATGPVYTDLGAVPFVLLKNEGSLFIPDWNLFTHAYSNTSANNIIGNPMFVAEYLNGNPGLSPSQGEFQTIAVAPALDEGGNWLDVRYAPLSINDTDSLDNGVNVPSNYHLSIGSPAINSGNGNRPNGNTDIDDDVQSGIADIGSDEVL